MNKKLVILSALTVSLLPSVILAVATVPLPTNTITNISTVINAIFNLIWPIFAAFAVVMFIVAGVLFLTANGEPGKVNQARQALIWGTVGMGTGLLAFSVPFIIKSVLGV